MSAAWLKSFAKTEHIVVARRGNRPGVDWATVEAYIARSRITRVDETPHRDPDRPIRGVALLDLVQARFGWSDRQLARALGVTPAVVSGYRRSGVPNWHCCVGGLRGARRSRCVRVLVQTALASSSKAAATRR
jgi:hypothetical protein